jgi:hypothetical protein
MYLAAARPSENRTSACGNAFTGGHDQYVRTRLSGLVAAKRARGDTYCPAAACGYET